MSFARKHFQRITAEAEAIKASEQVKGTAATSTTGEVDTPSISGNQANQMLVQLKTHQRALSDVQSLTTKIERKAQYLPDYDDYIDAQLAANTGLQDEVLMTILVWYLDVGDLDCALEIASYAIQHKLALPIRFNRDLPTFLVEEIAEHINGNFKLLDSQNRQVSPEYLCKWMEWLYAVLVLTEGMDMPDEVKAKGLKALGQCVVVTDPKQAVLHYAEAIKLDEQIGLKGKLKALQKQIDTADEANNKTSSQNSDKT